MRCRLLLPMCAVSVNLSVTRLNSASLCGSHSVQPLPNHFGLLLVEQPVSKTCMLLARCAQLHHFRHFLHRRQIDYQPTQHYHRPPVSWTAVLPPLHRPHSAPDESRSSRRRCSAEVHAASRRNRSIERRDMGTSTGRWGMSLMPDLNSVDWLECSAAATTYKVLTHKVASKHTRFDNIEAWVP